MTDREPRWHWRNCRSLRVSTYIHIWPWVLQAGREDDVYGGRAWLSIGPIGISLEYDHGNVSSGNRLIAATGLSETEAWDRALPVRGDRRAADGRAAMSRIYVASSWRNSFQPGVVKLLRAAGHAVYDFRHPINGVPGFAWSEIDPGWQAWSAARYRELLTTHPIAARGFVSDLRGMQWADTCVLVLPCGRSAHLEAGWFCGQGKRCLILTRDGEEPELMALLATDICVSLEEVLQRLQDGSAGAEA